MGTAGAEAISRAHPRQNRLVLVGDGGKVPKQRKKMPAVKLLHQVSESNSKADYIMGHSFQAVPILTQAANSVFAVSLAMRIHEGLIFSNRDQHTLHTFALVGIVSQGLLHYLASCFPELVWRSFGSWLRTIRPGIPPPELVVATALRHSFPEFLKVNSQNHSLAKFIVERQDFDRLRVFWNTS